MSSWDDCGEEASGRIVAVRPGRRLFVRRIVFGSNSDKSTSSKAVPPTLLFVHGSCATERHYHRLVKAMQDEVDSPFQPGTTCVLYDLAGCGLSPPPERPGDSEENADGGSLKRLATLFRSWITSQDCALYGNDESIQDLRAIIAMCAPSSSPLFLVGHSYAANLILPYLLEECSSLAKDDALAGDKATKIAGVLLLSCGTRTPSNPLPDGGVPLIRKLPLTLLNCIQSSLTSGFVAAALHPESARQNPDVVGELVEYCNSNRMEVVQAYHSQVRWFSLPHSTSTATTPTSLPMLPFPFLIVHGDQDKIIPIEAGQELANQLRHELHVVRNVGHMVTMERPREVASLVRDFVEAHR